MRRGVGIAGLQKQQLSKQQYKEVGNAVAAETLVNLQERMESFKTLLQDFARKYAKEIRKNPTFRARFHQMCSNIGVDPLASNKGFWAELLGVGDFYFELGVQIVDICLELREQTGGLVELTELQRRLQEKRTPSSRNKSKGVDSKSLQISEDDISRAIATLSPLGSYYKLIKVGSKKFVQSTPEELNMDHLTLLSLCSGGTTEGVPTSNSTNVCYFKASEAVSRLKWSEERVSQALEHLIANGMVWIDDQDQGSTSNAAPTLTSIFNDNRLYWVSSLCSNLLLSV